MAMYVLPLSLRPDVLLIDISDIALIRLSNGANDLNNSEENGVVKDDSEISARIAERTVLITSLMTLYKYAVYVAKYN